MPKKTIAAGFILLLAIGFGFWLVFRDGSPRKVTSNLQVRTIPIRSPSAVAGGKIISIAELTPEYELKRLGMTAKFNQSNIIDVIEALWNIPENDNEAYLALMDDGVRKKYEESHSGSKAADAPVDLDAEPPRSAITHLVDIESQGTLYRIAVGKQILPGGESPQFHLVFLNRGERWVQTFALAGNELKSIIGSASIDELKQQFAF